MLLRPCSRRLARRVVLEALPLVDQRHCVDLTGDSIESSPIGRLEKPRRFEGDQFLARMCRWIGQPYLLLRPQRRRTRLYPLCWRSIVSSMYLSSFRVLLCPILSSHGTGSSANTNLSAFVVDNTTSGLLPLSASTWG